MAKGKDKENDCTCKEKPRWSTEDSAAAPEKHTTTISYIHLKCKFFNKNSNYIYRSACILKFKD